MSVPRSVAEVLADHVTLEVEGIDRMYLNVYIPGLQREQGVACFFRFHRGNQFVSKIVHRFRPSLIQMRIRGRVLMPGARPAACLRGTYRL